MKLWAKKSLGQHFLHSDHVLKLIVDAAQLHPGDTVLEIGPGTGILTKALLEKGVHVVAVEKDARAIPGLQELSRTYATQGIGSLTVIEGDILTLDISTHIHGTYALVANIPYYITGAILEKFLEYEPRPTKMVLLVQKEVAERIVARDGKESVLSISVKAFGKPYIVAKVPRGAFVPPPRVESAILAIEHISGHVFSNEHARIRRFFDVLKAGFAHKRKYVATNLEQVIDRATIQRIWKELSLDPQVRAEHIPTEIWLKIYMPEPW